ncbi:MAG: hypothetical protein L6V93_19840 [Clostridiales bacterium]|nr:MAG: hypothetical protein L6V93_19840 [Clostridiales bacterium]
MTTVFLSHRRFGNEKNAYRKSDSDEYNTTYTAVAADGANAVICSSTGNITYMTAPANAQAHADFANTKLINADEKPFLSPTRFTFLTKKM